MENNTSQVEIAHLKEDISRLAGSMDKFHTRLDEFTKQVTRVDGRFDNGINKDIAHLRSLIESTQAQLMSVIKDLATLTATLHGHIQQESVTQGFLQNASAANSKIEFNSAVGATRDRFERVLIGTTGVLLGLVGFLFAKVMGWI